MLRPHMENQVPRSTDPRNYGPFYEKLGLLMDAGENDIKLRMSGRLAVYHRNNFYAYINALKHESVYAYKRKTLDAAEQIDQADRAAYMESVLRRYLVVITPMDPDAEDVELRFVIRGMDERQAPGIVQLDELIEQTHAVERVEQHHKLLGQLQHGAMDFKAVAPEQLRGKASPVAHFFGGVEPSIDEDMTDELAEEILHGNPHDSTDMSDLIPQSNQGDSTTKTYRDQAIEDAQALRDKERE